MFYNDWLKHEVHTPESEHKHFSWQWKRSSALIVAKDKQDINIECLTSRIIQSFINFKTIKVARLIMRPTTTRGDKRRLAQQAGVDDFLLFLKIYLIHSYIDIWHALRTAWINIYFIVFKEAL